MRSTRIWTSFLPALVLGVAACASPGKSPPQTGPTDAGVAALPPPDLTPRTQQTGVQLLEPPEAAVRAADAVVLTGAEMGTMWTFENPPLDRWETTYGFRPSAEWLEHVRLASVRYGRGCSASFVSPAGLVITNNHCARRCIDDVSTPENDYLIEGFYAATRDEERVCPGLFLDQLVEIEDVTTQLHGAARRGMTDADIASAQRTVRAELVETCQAQSGLTCQVVSLFHGGQYQLYKYRRFRTVKLVFTPDLQAASFGGDPDNFTYPRYDLDVTFVRAYEDDGATPAATPHYFGWDADGAEEGELVFVTGNPGSTSRQIAMSEYLYERQVRHPLLLDFFDSRLEVLHAIAARDPVRGRALQNTTLGLENSQKLYRGQLEGLRDTLLTAKKIKWEWGFRTAIEQEPELRSAYADLWDRLAAIQARKATVYPSYLIHNPNFLSSSAHLQLAAILTDYAAQLALPEQERSGAYRGDSLVVMEGRLRDPGPMDEDLSIGMLAGQLEIAARWLPAIDPMVGAMRVGESPREAAVRLVNGSRIEDPEFRSQIMAGGPPALEAADDPLLDLARTMLELRREAVAAWEALRTAEDVQSERFAAALFGAFGMDLPPDATFTLRVSDGVVKRYAYNGTYAPAQTTLYGLYGRAAEFGNQAPWTLPSPFAARREHVNLSVPINFVSTNDITGGNSGSPVVNREARIVGVAFDGNVEAFPNEFLFAAENGRTVSVHTAGISEALRNVYEAEELLQELLAGADRLLATRP